LRDRDSLAQSLKQVSPSAQGGALRCLLSSYRVIHQRESYYARSPHRSKKAPSGRAA
jgi:hypothetical protein